MDLFVLDQGRVEGCWEHGGGPLYSIKWDPFLDEGRVF
jgi:hypothetical protein